MIPCCYFYSTCLNYYIVSQYGVSPTITVASDVLAQNAKGLTYNEVQTILKSKVSDGSIKIVSGSLNYASVHLARSFSSTTTNNEALCDLGVGCSYHSSVSVTKSGVTSTLYYAVIPNIREPIFGCARNCGPLENNENQHAVMLHELAETVTNPNNGAGWVASNPAGEVADLVSFHLSRICFN